MKVSPVSSPHAIAPTQSSFQAEQSAKAKAVAAFMGQKTQQQVVQDQNAISPEEMGAVIPKIDNRVSSENQVQDPEGQEETQEASSDAPQAPEATQAKDPALSRQFAQLARQEKAFRAKVHAEQQALKAQKAALDAREAEFAAKGSQTQDMSQYISRDRLKSDPLSVLAEAEISYDALTQQVINQQPTDPRVLSTIQSLQAEIKSLKQANEDSKKSYAENQTQAYNAAVKQIELDARNLVKSDANFETIRAAGAVKDVVELITETYNKDGVLLSVEEAAQQVEDYLVEEATKLAKLQKIQSRLKANQQANQTSQAQKTQNAQQKPQPQMKTLTNSASSSRQLTAKERAILAFKGELKS